MNEMNLLTRFRAEVPLRISPHAEGRSTPEFTIIPPNDPRFGRPAPSSPASLCACRGGTAARRPSCSSKRTSPDRPVARAAISLAPSAPQVPFAWKIRLTWSIRATGVAQSFHESRILHGNFRMVELMSEDGCLRG
jgi:hypothetical protein